MYCRKQRYYRNVVSHSLISLQGGADIVNGVRMELLREKWLDNQKLSKSFAMLRNLLIFKLCTLARTVQPV